MNVHDEGLFALDRAAYLNGVQREVAEELIIPEPLENRVVAMINDDSNPVGQVHLGVVHVMRLPEPRAAKRESNILNVEFLEPVKLRSEKDDLETWSQICLENLERLIAV